MITHTVLRSRRRGLAPAAAALALAVAAGGCSDTDTDTGADGAATTTAATDGTARASSRTRHVLLVGLDGLTPGTLSDPAADLLTRLAERGATGDAAAPAPAADGTCSEGWAGLLRAGGAATGANGLDELRGALDQLELGAFVADPALAPVVTPSDPKAKTATAQVDVPGLQAWPKSLLEVEQVRDAAIREVATVEAPSVVVVQADLLASGPPEPRLAVDGSDDVVDFLLQAVDGRRHRADEEWLVVVSGVCAADGQAALFAYGDGIDPDAPAGALQPGSVVGLIAAYLGIEAGDGWPPAPEGLLDDTEVSDGKATS